MPFFADTPEALVQRSDSKNPNSTCRGITNNGRPCRRAIAGAIPPPKSKKTADDASNPDNYCWQHKDQAQARTPDAPPMTSIQERTSIDTLVDRLGLLNAGNGAPAGQTKPSKPPRPQKTSSQAGGRPSKPPSTWRLICCALVEDDDTALSKPTQPVRPSVSRPPASGQSTVSVPGGRPSSTSRPRPNSSRPSASGSQNSGRPSSNPQLPARPGEGLLRPPTAPGGGRSKTQEYLSLIPSSLPAETASQLLAELVKPVSTGDDEGYIYIFWLTPESATSPPPLETARSLLSPPEDPLRPNASQRRASDALKSYAASKNPGNKTILLKIGRASNVQRRLNEWTRQCGYEISLIRYYPYYKSNSPSHSPTSSSAGLSPPNRRARAHSAEPPGPSKIPYSHKVERLIHIELASQRSIGSGKCERCGREHREWFEVDASREGIAAVDAVIRRWTDWSFREAAGL